MIETRNIHTYMFLLILKYCGRATYVVAMSKSSATWPLFVIKFNLEINAKILK